MGVPAGVGVLAGVGDAAGLGVLACSVAPTFGVLGLGLELPPPQAVTSAVAMATATMRKSADVIFVVLSKGSEPKR